MPIPKLNEEGLLPVGIHHCTFSELEAAFGRNQWVQDPQTESRREVLCPQRSSLCARLLAYLEELRRAGIDAEVLVDGSFVTAKPDPNDIDLIVVLPADHDFSRGLSPQEYNLLSKRRLRASGYPFDVLVAAQGGTAYETALHLFQQVRGRADLTKGLVRVRP
jgi:hypothetical protein